MAVVGAQKMKKISDSCKMIQRRLMQDSLELMKNHKSSVAALRNFNKMEDSKKMEKCLYTHELPKQN